MENGPYMYIMAAILDLSRKQVVAVGGFGEILLCVKVYYHSTHFSLETNVKSVVQPKFFIALIKVTYFDQI